jgi:phosphatidylinositol alpha-1,6-mannosyltransferase
VVLACDIRTVLVAFLAKALTGRAYRVGVHGSEVSKFGRASGLKRLFRAAYLGADMISANSRATLDLVEAAFGSSGRGVVNHLGVDRRWFAPAHGGFEHPALAALPPTAALVATVGRIEERKGQREAVRVVAAARRLRPELDLVYVVAGRPESEAYAAEVAALADRLAVPIVFTGRAPEADLARLYRRSACHLLCAQPEKDRIEGFGLVLLEAAAQGCPSVATRVGGIPEVVAADGGAVRAPDDLEGLAEAVAGYAADPARRAAAGAAARRHAEGFSWRRCAQGSFPELYRGAKKD